MTAARTAATPAHRAVDPSDIRVSTIELFFDLVFVFTITQLTSLLAEDPTALGAVRMILVFGNVWWMYGGYAWLTNAVPPREPGLRLLMLVGMAGFLVVRPRHSPRLRRERRRLRPRIPGGQPGAHGDVPALHRGEHAPSDRAAGTV